MIKKIEDSARMTMNEAEEFYPDNHILMLDDEEYMVYPIGRVVYIGDNRKELYDLLDELPEARSSGS